MSKNQRWAFDARSILLLSSSVLLLGACAQIPELRPAEKMQEVAALTHASALQGPERQWPDADWWRAYGDTQLNGLIAEALQSAPTLAIAEARRRQAEAGLQLAGAALLPQVSANVALSEQRQSYNYLSPRAGTPQGWNDYGRATLDFSWELDFWGKNRAALAAATSDKMAAEVDVAQARLVLASSITAAYAELARLESARSTAELALQVHGKTADLFRRRHQSGLETLGGVRQVESKQASAEVELGAFEEQIALQKNVLAALLGAGPDRALNIAKPRVDFSRPFALPQRLGLELLGRRPDIVAARLRAEAAARRITARQAEFYPSVNLTAFLGVQALGLDLLARSGSTVGSLGPAISLPIFNTQRLQGQYRAAAAEYDEAVLGYNSTLIRALREVADAAVSQKALRGQLQASQRAVTAAREAHTVANNRYTGGLSSYLEVLTAEDALLAALRSQSDLQSRSFSLDVALVKALGGGYRMAAE